MKVVTIWQANSGSPLMDQSPSLPNFISESPQIQNCTKEFGELSKREGNLFLSMLINKTGNPRNSISNTILRGEVAHTFHPRGCWSQGKKQVTQRQGCHLAGHGMHLSPHYCSPGYQPRACPAGREGELNHHLELRCNKSL